MFVIHSGNEQISNLLLKYGANVNARDYADETPLHKSVHKYGGNWPQKLVFLALKKSVI